MNNRHDDPVLVELARHNPVENQPARPDILESVLFRIRHGRTGAADGRHLRHAYWQSRWPLAIAAVVIALSVSTWVVVRTSRDAASSTPGTSASPSASSDPMLFSAPPSAADAKYVAAVRAESPLVGPSVNCGAVLPAGVLAMPADAENGTSPISATIRQFIKDDPWHLPSINAGRWLILAASDDRWIVGQRTGRVGIGTVVVFVGRNGLFVPDHTEGCTSYFDDGQTAERIHEVTVEGASATITWVRVCDSAGHAYSVSKVGQVSTAGVTHLLLLTKPDPSAPCTAEASAGRTTVRLDSPYRPGNTFYDDSVIPADKIS